VGAPLALRWGGEYEGLSPTSLWVSEFFLADSVLCVVGAYVLRFAPGISIMLWPAFPLFPSLHVAVLRFFLKSGPMFDDKNCELVLARWCFFAGSQHQAAFVLHGDSLFYPVPPFRDFSVSVFAPCIPPRPAPGSVPPGSALLVNCSPVEYLCSDFILFYICTALQWVLFHARNLS